MIRCRTPVGMEPAGRFGADKAQAFGEMGRLYLAYDLVEPTAACLANAVALAPGDPRWSYLLGALCDNERRLEQAAVAFEATLALASMRSQPSTDAAETVAMALAELGRFAEAIGWQERAIGRIQFLGFEPSEATARRLLDYRNGRPCRDPWPDRTGSPDAGEPSKKSNRDQ